MLRLVQRITAVGLACAGPARPYVPCVMQRAPSLRAALHMSVRAQVKALTVRVPPESTSVAQILNDACSNDAGLYVAARDEHGSPVGLGSLLDRATTSLTFIPFDSEDKLAQRTFWRSAGYVLAAALQKVCGSELLVGGAPAVFESTGAMADASSGFSIEALRCAPPAPIPRGADIVASRAAAIAALDALVAAQAGSPKLRPEDLASAEHVMKTMVAAATPISVETMSWDTAWGIFATNPLALAALTENAAMNNGQVHVVRVGSEPFVGPAELENAVVLRRTKPIKATKLLGWSAASLGPRDAQPLLRVRGISFPSAQHLQAFGTRIAEAEKSDHRVLGLAQSLFFAHDSSPGSPFVLPHGMRMMRKIERVIRDLYDAFGYEEVQTPQLYRRTLWQQSGHWDKYREDMFGAQGMGCCGGHDESFGLKPMNCPGHCVMFAHEPRSYRDLPMRFAEFSPLHRNEASGALTGLTRVRRFHQDDAHVFCTDAQIASEIEAMLHMLVLAYQVFGFGERLELVLSTRPESFIGDVKMWDAAETSLTRALEASGRPWSLNAGDGAFYGPKIDIRLVDAMGRKHQTATIQLDFQLPERFQLEYAQPPHAPPAEGVRAGFARPVMIHRAILGSFERFAAILIEQCRGWWPFWLSPRQAVIIPAATGDARVAAYAEHVQHALSGTTEEPQASRRNPFLALDAAHATLAIPSRIRFQVELPPHYLAGSDTLGKKVRQAQLSRYNFVVIVGAHEARTGTVSLRMRDERAAPAWHAGSGGEPLRVQDMIVRVLRASFPERFPPSWMPNVDLGSWSIDEVRRLFAVLDALHV